MDCIEQYKSNPELAGKIRWDICSDGDAREEIEALSKKYKNVKYHGRLSPTELRELYKQSDLLFMPSRFLEMFGLTALEALSLGTPVCGPAKGGLRDFVTPELTLDESDPVWSLRDILIQILDIGMPALQDVSDFGQEKWEQRLETLTRYSERILILHDYHEKIWGAEYYVDSLLHALEKNGKTVEFSGYSGHTSPWKRRIMFVLSIFAFWRGIQVWMRLSQLQPDLIWMHSVLRYIGPWGVLAVRLYRLRHLTLVYLSHHDLGLLAAFPQDITDESDIPMSPSLRDFIPAKGILKQFISIGKWCYVRIIKLILSDDITHVIFAPFLEANIRGQFGKRRIYKEAKISQKQEVRGRKIFSKWASWDGSDWEINVPNEEIRSFSEISIQIFPHQSIVGT
jgi:glycosyltransferase involved in cell wall biosynthesis